jgi:hypothetical protein
MSEALLQTLKAWADVQARLDGNRNALRSLHDMEATGGEPDVIGKANDSDSLIFCDCSPESPLGRRSTCYDAEARTCYGKVFVYHNGAQSYYAARGFRGFLRV